MLRFEYKIGANIEAYRKHPESLIAYNFISENKE